MLKPKTVKGVTKGLKKALDIAKVYGPLIPPAIATARKTLRESKKTVREFQSFGFQPACVDCVKTIIDDLVARDKWCIARLGEICLRCHRKVDAFGRALD